MRLSLLVCFASGLLASGCSLDREGLGEYSGSEAGGSSQAGSGGSGGSQPVDSSAGFGGTSIGGNGGSGGSGGSAGTGGAGGSGGSSALDGSAGSGGLDAGNDAPVEVGPDTPLVEDCFNGQDDDNDGKVDCDDTDCTSVVVCVPAAPAGWSAPGFEWTRGAGEAAADCGDFEAAGTFHAAFEDTPPSCGCGCGLPNGGVCTGGSAQVYSGDDCVAAFVQVVGNACYPLVGSGSINGNYSAIGTPATPSSQGACTPHASGTVEPAAWTDAADLCVAKQTFGGCGAGLVCVPRSPTGFPPQACVLRSGALTCPAAYPAGKTWYTGLLDTRACSVAGCTCGVASGGSCGGKMRFHSDDTCGATTAVGVFDLDGTCKNTHQGAAQIKSLDFQATGPTGGNCAAAGTGSLTGSVSPSGPNTICCQTPTN